MKKELFLIAVSVALMLTGCKDKDDSQFDKGSSVGITKAERENKSGNDDVNTYSDEQLLELARELFSSACRMTEKYISGSAYVTDRSMSSTRDGSAAYLVSDSMVSSMDDIYSEWNSVFSLKYESIYSDIFSNYFEQNSKIWAVQKPYAKNKAYVDTVISEISERTEDEVTFNVVSSYKNDDGSKKTTTMPFSVVYSTGMFKVGKFIMPY